MPTIPPQYTTFTSHSTLTTFLHSQAKPLCSPANAELQLTDCNDGVGIRIGTAELGVVCWRQEAQGGARDEQDDVILEEDAHAAELLLAQPGG
jgi:hypothetical protein